MEDNQKMNENYRKPTIEEIHTIDQELLDEVERICKENNLKYYLTGGTLLGAIRHKGPIPWDDDADVAMPRKDFEKFKKIMLSKPEGEVYHIHCYDNDSTYPKRMMQLLKRNTKYFTMNNVAVNDKYMEIWIDIFPLDDVPGIIDWKYRFHCWFMRKMKIACHLKISKFSRLRPKKKLAYILVLPFSLQRIMLWDLKLMRKYERNEAKGYVNWAGRYDYIKETLQKEWFEPSVKVEYGGKYYPAPREWDKVLTRLYGDYMTPPPAEKRMSHEIE